MKQNDRTVYDSEGKIVCRPVIPLKAPDKRYDEGRDTLRGLQTVKEYKDEGIS